MPRQQWLDPLVGVWAVDEDRFAEPRAQGFTIRIQERPVVVNDDLQELGRVPDQAAEAGNRQRDLGVAEKRRHAQGWGRHWLGVQGHPRHSSDRALIILY